MAALTTMLILGGLALGAAGVATSIYSSQQQAKAQQKSLELQKQMEARREQQMTLEAQRRKREIIRQSMQARSQALAATTASGASDAGGSALGGAYGGISGAANNNLLGVSQNEEIGHQMFGLNREMLGTYQDAAGWGAVGSLGQGMTTIGGAMMQNAGQINQVGGYLRNRFQGFSAFA